MSSTKRREPNRSDSVFSSSDSISDSTDTTTSSDEDQTDFNHTPFTNYCSGGTQGGFRTSFRSGRRHGKVLINPYTNRTRTISAQGHEMQRSGKLLRYRTDLNKVVIHFMMERLGCGGSGENSGGSRVEEVVIPGNDDDRAERIDAYHGLGDWQLFWMSVNRIRSIYLGQNLEFRLAEGHIINHFPNHYELTRKDLMYRNIRQYVKEASGMGQDGIRKLQLQVALNWESAASFAGSVSPSERDRRQMETYCFTESVPITYNIPNDMNLFIEEFKKQVGVTWIVKPTSRCQGKGIFLVNRLPQILKWAKEKREAEQHYAFSGVSSAASTSSSGQSMMGSFIVSKYISNPLLIGKKKFDLRLYVLVTSFKPLVAYLHESGFARFCATKYSEKCVTEEDLGAHLTNVALQKGDDAYNTFHGGKWLVKQLMLYVQCRYGAYKAEGLMAKIKFLVAHSLLSMKDVMHNDKHSFELYGYDVLIDSYLNPHLIEVNASPSLSTTTTTDRLLKEEVLCDTMRIVLPPGCGTGKGSSVSYSEHRLRSDLGSELGVGFSLL